jgi:hypothetical protein
MHHELASSGSPQEAIAVHCKQSHERMAIAKLEMRCSRKLAGCNVAAILNQI